MLRYFSFYLVSKSFARCSVWAEEFRSVCKLATACFLSQLHQVKSKCANFSLKWDTQFQLNLDFVYKITKFTHSSFPTWLHQISALLFVPVVTTLKSRAYQQKQNMDKFHVYASKTADEMVRGKNEIFPQQQIAVLLLLMKSKRWPTKIIFSFIFS